MLFRAICGLIVIDDGEIYIQGEKIDGNIIPQDIGLLLENPSFLKGLTGLQNLEIIASIRKIVNVERILQVLDKVGLTEAKDKKYEAYSLGMKQRLAIANVIMEDPKILIFDEPTIAIDEEGIKVLKEIISKEKKKGKLILLASHEHDFISSLVDVHFYMKEGALVEKNR